MRIDESHNRLVEIAARTSIDKFLASVEKKVAMAQEEVKVEEDEAMRSMVHRDPK